jgi:hypothetical protein
VKRFAREILAPGILIGGTGSILCWSIWGKTGDILIDFGNDLYVSWRVSQGDVLFRDVAYLYGPLSPTIYASAMRICGAGIGTILGLNLGILVLTTGLVYWLMRGISGPLARIVGAIFFLGVFALSSPTKIANYNFLTPYAGDITLGFLLALGTIACVDWVSRGGRIIAATIGGVLAGAVFLTKPEIFLGCAISYFAGLGAALWAKRERQPLFIAASAAAAMLIAPLGFFIYFLTQMPFRAALNGILGGWQFVNKAFVVQTPFYKGDFGADEPGRNFGLMMEYAGIYAGVFVALGILGWIGGRRPWAGVVCAVVAGIAGLACVTYAGEKFDSFWLDVGRGFPVFAVFAMVVMIDGVFRGRAAPAGLAMAVLSLILLGKILLNARMYHYGFILGAPCGMMLVVALMDWLPGRVKKFGGSPAVVRWGAIGLLGAVVLENVKLTQANLSERTVEIPLALGGRAWARPIDQAGVDAIRWLSTVSGTAAVIPDAAGIDYAAGKASGIPYTEMHPMGMQINGEQNVFAAFQRHPPDYVLVMETQEAHFGASAFGKDYGRELWLWIRGNYRYEGTFAAGRQPIEMWKLGRPMKGAD